MRLWTPYAQVKQHSIRGSEKPGDLRGYFEEIYRVGSAMVAIIYLRTGRLACFRLRLVCLRFTGFKYRERENSNDDTLDSLWKYYHK